MITKEIQESNNIIAKFIGFEQSEVEPDYWWCKEKGLSLLKFHEDWEWLMDAITKIQKRYEYRLQTMPYNVNNESLLLSKFITSLKNKV